MYVEDTIAAIATPPGSGGIGVIRVSGPAAAAIASRVFKRTKPGCWETHRLYIGTVVDPQERTLDEALGVLMRGPHSYTGEDVFEIHCHGSPVVLRQALAAVLQAGARPATAGEFTKRAFLNGRKDLTQAEAVIDLIRARTVGGAEQAADQLFGRLSQHLDELRRQLLRVKAVLEVQIDFSEEEVDWDPSATQEVIRDVLDRIAALRQTYDRGRLFREGLQVAIVGRPNAGKSSLLNALLGIDRAIVTPLPGTTRDVIEETIDIDGIPVVLRDTAGLREAPDEVERIGVERAGDVARASDVVLHVVDSTTIASLSEECIVYYNTIIVLNKIDLMGELPTEAAAAFAPHRVVQVSATEKMGLETLRHAIVAGSDRTPQDGIPVLTSRRQFHALTTIADCLRSAVEGLQQARSADLVAVDVQSALEHIASITGAVTSDDVLDVIFREFCIGK